ncbi:phosphotransferase-like protein [Metarhizium guizhouense ARSEF 977]|uniref:Phosphotransferase-like protein n=1 Tax=Metarhizium guizhouense (strain ARSEF 977) TaxID=1276136 RepID=A0A0B4GQM9_METGA|nr:phosphotransferase-like protein [Metarhizium guizhouense ARSEF 977]
MSENEIDRLKKELEQVRRENEINRLKKELEQVRRENETNRLKKELEQVRCEKEEAKAWEEPEQRKFQDTTLEEYLHNCHVHLYRNLIFADTSRSSTGFTRVDGNYYPKWLRPWHDFKEIHRRRHFEAIKAACKERRLFPPEIITTDIGSSMIRRGRGDEIDISLFEKFVVEGPVWKILRPVWDIKDLRQEYRCSNVRFGNSRRDITAVSDQEPSTPQDSLKQGLEQRRRTGPSKRMASKQKVKPSLIKPDGWGVREYPDGGESHAFVFDYKTAHDISPACSRTPFEELCSKKHCRQPMTFCKRGESPPARQYCTQACLLGLKRYKELDDNCPNVCSHRAAKGGNRHPIDADTFTRLMCEQLRQSPYHKCDALDGWGKWGAVGMLFKLELEPYGYTLVGKGALSGRPRDLEHESNIYARLDQLQGYVVPVHLGTVELDWGYILAGGVRDSESLT